MIAPTFPVSRLDEIVEIGQLFFNEAKVPGRFDASIVKRTWEHILGIGAGEIFPLEENGKFVGGLGAIVYPDANDGELVATEMFWYVKPDKRGGGLRLFSRFEEWAKQCGAKRTIMVHLTSLMPSELELFYKKRGYSPIETHYIKENL